MNKKAGVNKKAMAKRASSPTARVPAAMARPVAAALAPWLAKPAAKRGFRDARLMAEWGTIVGDELGGRTRPDKLDRRGSHGVLRLVVAPGWAIEVQHLEPQILERINRFFGATVVTRLALKQGPVAPPSMPRKVRAQAQPSPDTERALMQACAAVEDPELAVILERLGRQILR